MRAPGRDRVDVKVSVDRGPVQSVEVGRDWSTLTIDLPPPGQTTRFRRINIKCDIPRPATTGTDGRPLGVQIGTTRFR